MSICFDSLSNDITLCSTKQVNDKASPLFKKNVMKGCENIPSYVNNSPWYDNECVEKKNEFLNLLNRYRNDQCDLNRINMLQARSIYKSTVRKCRFNYDKEKNI
jgi:hypothetical protein